MSARHKLNHAYVNGAMVIAGVIGACTESWTAFMMFTAVFVALSCHSGDIRPRRTGRRGPARKS